MKKIELIDPKEYFRESKKTIGIIKEYEKEVKGQLPSDQKLEIAKKLLEKVKTREEYEELNEEIKKLEFDVKYGKGHTPAVPEQYQNRIAFNRVHEEEQLDKELQKQKELLHDLLSNVEEPLRNVLMNIERLEETKLIGVEIDVLLEKQIIFDPTIPHASYFLKTSSTPHLASVRKANHITESLITRLRSIASEPAERDGVLKPGIIKRILGGNK